MSFGMLLMGCFNAGASGPAVSPRADGDANTNSDAPGPVTCYQGCHFDADGQEYEVLGSTGNQTNATTWLDSGSASDVWVEFVYTSGSQASWSSHSNSTRYNLGSNQRFSYSVTRLPSGSTARTLTGYFRMWDAATGGNILWTGSTVSWSATATVF